MSRYLTPSKIGLLSLVSIYVEDVVPSASTIPVLSFVLSHLLPVDAATLRRSSRKPALQIEDFENAVFPHASSIPGRTVWDLLLKRFWEINSFDALHLFFDSLKTLLARTRDEEAQAEEDGTTHEGPPIRLARTSPLGAFVRRAQLEFVRLQLDDSIALWKSFIAYRDPTLSSWRRRNPKASRLSFDAQLGDCTNLQINEMLYGSNTEVVLRDASASTDDMESLLEFQIDQMQKLGFRVPDEIRKRFRDMFEAGTTVSSLSYYIKFLDSWKAGDYPSSFDNLHRYFDYTMQSRDRSFYQYALLNLAILQADFGCFPEALAAMHEAVLSARESRDVICLNYSLSWMYHFGKAHPKETAEIQKSGMIGSDKEALSFLKSRAKDTQMWSLLSTSLLGEAKLTQINGESLGSAFESIVKASHLNVMKNIPGAFGSQMIVESSVYGRLGLRYLAWSRNELFLECYADQSSLEDILQFKCRAALFQATKGRYNEALASMEEVSVDALRTLKYQQFWIAYIGLLKLRHAIYRGHFDAASSFLAQLRANPPISHDVGFATELLAIELSLRRRNHPAAMAAVDAQLAAARALSPDSGGSGTTDAYHVIKLLVLKARVYDRAGLPHRGFSAALRAASLALRARFMPVLWEAVGALARVLLALREFDAAGALLRGIVPAVLEGEDCALIADTYASLADMYMGLAGEAAAGSSKRKEQMGKARSCLERAFDEYSRVKDVAGQSEMMAKRSTIMHLNGDLVLANDYASSWVDLQRTAREEIAA